MQYRFETKKQCARLRLRPGAIIRCGGGRLWITFEARGARTASPDLQLVDGQCLRVAVDGDYFITSLDAGASSRCIVDLSCERTGWLQSALRRLCAPASFLIQDATSDTSWRGCSSAWSSQYRFGLRTASGEGSTWS